MNEFVTREERGIKVHVLPTQKYKVNSIVATFTQELREETATGLALLPYVLMRGSERHPSPEQLQLALDQLYGATLSGTIDKKGERQIIDFTMTVPNAKFLATEDDLFQQALDILADVMLRPVTADGGFRPAYVQAEQEQQHKRIRAVLDDKIQFAKERLLEEMTKGEPFAIPRLGREEQVDAQEPQQLYALYQQVLKTAPMNVYVIGDVDVDTVASQIFRTFAMERAPEEQFAPVQTRHEVRSVREVVEKMDVNQGKLNIGLRANIAYADEDYPAMVIANGILGAFPHSKLFLNVREKHSLAYYASSRLDGLKGLLYIQAGVEVANFDKAIGIIKEQLNELKQGQITEEELSFTVNGMINSYKTAMDSATSLADIYMNGLIGGRVRMPDEMIQQLAQVTIDDVVRVSQGLVLDTVYMLRDQGGNA